jgi:hypothetical protein
VFDSSKEQLIPIWKELIERVKLKVNLGESVESVKHTGDVFEIRSTVAVYRAQRVVLGIGTRGKPRTLQVPGENLPKIFSLLEDPDDWRGKAVLVVGGGDSAVEAAMALADAGALVTLSYRGKSFARAAPKNKQAIEAYSSEGRLKVKLQSQILAFDPESVTMSLADGEQKRYSNDAAFVLIGADPPIAWLEKLGVQFIERHHQYQLGRSDQVVQRFVSRAVACPEDAARAAAQVLGGSIAAVAAGVDLGRANAASAYPIDASANSSAPRRWLRSATNLFSNRARSESSVGVPPPVAPEVKSGGRKLEARDGRKLDGPVPLSEFARQQRTGAGHSGMGRRDALSAGERTRILRMLRDEGGRLADEDSGLYIGVAPASDSLSNVDIEDSPAPAPAPPATSIRKPIAGATSRGGGLRARADQTKMGASTSARMAIPERPSARVPKHFGEEPTRQADSATVASLRDVQRSVAVPPPAGAKQVLVGGPDEATAMGEDIFGDEPETNYDPHAAMRTMGAMKSLGQQPIIISDADERTAMADAGSMAKARKPGPPTAPPGSRPKPSSRPPPSPATRQRPLLPPPNGSLPVSASEDERTRMGDAPKSSAPRALSGVDWDIE